MSYSETQMTLRESLPNKLFYDTLPPILGSEDFYHKWGFTVYRTAYGPMTDTYWEALLQTIRVNVEACVSKYHAINHGESTNNENEAKAGKLLLDFFRLDDRSAFDFKDKSLAELRDLYRKEPFHWSTDEDPGTDEAATQRPGVFFVADAEVLAAVEDGRYVFKCVEMDYVEREHVGHDRVPQTYWGWMPMTPLAVLPLWCLIKHGGFEMRLVAPPTKSEDGIRIWSGPDSTLDFGGEYKGQVARSKWAS